METFVIVTIASVRVSWLSSHLCHFYCWVSCFEVSMQIICWTGLKRNIFMTNIAFCITVFHKRKVHQNAAPFPLAHFVQMTMSRHTTVTVLLLIKTAAAASALRGRGSHVFLFFTQWQCAQLRWHHATFAYLISTVQLGCTPPHEKFLCPTQGRSKGGAHSDIKNK